MLSYLNDYIELLTNFNGSALLYFLSSLLFVSLVAILKLFRKISLLKRDTKNLVFGIRSLFNSGRAPQRIDIRTEYLSQAWRKILSFYSASIRANTSRADLVSVIGEGLGLVDAVSSEDELMQILSEIVLRSASPEAKFSAVLLKTPNSWKLVSSSGISTSRLEEPLVSAIETLNLSCEGFYYTSSRDGIMFDYRGLGIGSSLFVPMFNDSNVFASVWLGFSEGSGVLSESRKQTVEMIIKHAIASFNSAKRVKLKEEKSEDQKEKILSLSHDLKAPSMRALYALREIQHVLAAKTSQEEQHLIHEIEYALEEQLGMINSLFSLDNSNSSDTQIAPELEVSTMVKSRVESFRVVARAASIDLSVSCVDRAKVRIPREVFFRILDNLLTNAIKYTSSGSIEVIVRLLDSSNIQVEVSDTGRGVPENIRKVLFSNEIRNLEREVNSGQGYGLTSVKRFVEEHGGRVSYMPNSKGGSSFFFSLPVTSVLESTQRTELDAKGGILVIDDDIVLRNTYERWLHDSTEKLITCSSFFDAKVAIEFDKPSMIIMDASIPGENVHEFLSHLPTSIPIIICSGMSIDLLKEQFSVYEQIVGILEKPFTRIELREVLKKYFTMKITHKLDRGLNKGLDKAA